MPITKQKKVQIIELIKKKIAGAGSVVFVNFHGLNVSTERKLRRSLKERGVGYTVVKKTLLKRVLPETPELEGEVALAYGLDPFLPAKGIYEFQQKIKEGLKILGGLFEKKLLSAGEMIKIAQIPPRHELYGRLVLMLSWPLRSLAVVVDQISKNKK